MHTTFRAANFMNFSFLFITTHFADYHKVFFCTFIVTSEIYMMLSYYLNKSARRNPNLDHRELKSLRLKRNLCIINILSILLATYFFIRHNDHCEGGSKLNTQRIFIQQRIKISFINIHTNESCIIIIPIPSC